MSIRASRSAKTIAVDANRSSNAFARPPKHLCHVAKASAKPVVPCPSYDYYGENPRKRPSLVSACLLFPPSPPPACPPCTHPTSPNTKAGPSCNLPAHPSPKPPARPSPNNSAAGHLRHVWTRKSHAFGSCLLSFSIAVAVARAHSPTRHGSHRTIMSSPDQAIEKKEVAAPTATPPAEAPEAPAAPAEKERTKEAQPGDAGDDSKGKISYGTALLVFNSRHAVCFGSRHASTNKRARPLDAASRRASVNPNTPYRIA